MKTFLSCLCIVASMLFITGCAWTKNIAFMSPFHPDDYKELKDVQAAFEAERKDVLTEYDKSDTTPARKLELRDKYVRIHIKNYDYLCWKFRSELYGRSAGVMSGGKIAALGLSTAAAVTSPVHSSQVLSGISAAVLGSTEVLKQEFFGNIAQYLIVGKMDKLREQKKQAIDQKLVADKTAVSAYPLSSVQTDLDLYLEACTVMSAVTSLAENNPKPETPAQPPVAPAPAAPARPAPPAAGH